MSVNHKPTCPLLVFGKLVFLPRPGRLRVRSPKPKSTIAETLTLHGVRNGPGETVTTTVLGFAARCFLHFLVKCTKKGAISAIVYQKSLKKRGKLTCSDRVDQLGLIQRQIHAVGPFVRGLCQHDNSDVRCPRQLGSSRRVAPVRVGQRSARIRAGVIVAMR